MNQSGREGGPGASDGRPAVSVAIPVWNGEEFVAAAIESVLEQSYSDFELVVVDNASDDRTYDIAMGYAEDDDRISVHRNATNIGLSPNFARALELSNGTYFKWLAADDVMSARFLELAKAAFDSDPGLVIATAPMPYIDEDGAILEPDSDGVVSTHYGETFTDTPFPVDLTSASPGRRFRSILFEGTSNVFNQVYFGLIRASVLRAVPPLGHHMGAEKALLGRLLMAGRAVELSGATLARRLHPGHFGAQSRRDTLAGLNPGRRVSMLRSPIDQIAGYLRVVSEADIPRSEKRVAYKAVIEKAFRADTVKRLVVPGPANYVGIGGSRS